MTAADVTLLVIVLTFLAAAAARRVARLPEPVTLAFLGLAVGYAWTYVPGLPVIRLPPALVLFVFLPPLLTSAAYSLPLGGFRRNLRPIGLLTIGLLLATVAAAAGTVHMIAGMPWAAALVLGAIIAPPDPVAATAVASRTGLAHRLVIILEGEGLVNDAVAIVVYHLALLAATSGVFTLGIAATTLMTEVPVGVLVGLAVGWGVARVRRHLDDVTLEAGISLVVPYIAYALADRLHGSGVLAVVTLGFMLQRYRHEMSSPVSRLATHIVWGAVQFVSNALVFFLLGLLIGQILAEVEVSWRLAGIAVALSAVVVLLRLAWMHVVPRVTRLLPNVERDPLPSSAELTVLGWAGMRGVVSLALALALPDLPRDAVWGDLRAAIILLTFGVILFTLFLQGATLTALVTHLGAGDPGREARDEARVRARTSRVGLAALARARRHGALSDAVCEQMSTRLRDGEYGLGGGVYPFRRRAEADALVGALDAQRRALEQARNLGRLSAPLAARLETQLDADVARIRGETARLTGAPDDA